MKTIAIVKYGFTAIGLCLLIGALFWYRSTSAFLDSAARAEGTVVDLVEVRSNDSSSSTYKPVVQFTTQKGETTRFASSVSSNPPSYSRGEAVEVLYNAAAPQEAKINGFFSLWGGAMILGIMGGVFSLIGGIIILVGVLTGRKDEYLKTHGTPISTDFQSVELNKALTVNSRNPFRILTQWQNPATSEVHIFKSNNLWFDPTNFIKSKKITVFIDGGNPKKYYVDVAFLPKVAE